METRTVGKSFTARDGKVYRPSMFITLTLPSYGRIVRGQGVPVDPARYDYRRAALDAMHFSKLVDRWVQNLRRGAGFQVQYFAAIEPQRRLALAAGRQRQSRSADARHASAAMTLDVYAGLFADDLDSVAERLDAAVTQSRADSLRTADVMSLAELGQERLRRALTCRNA